MKQEPKEITIMTIRPIRMAGEAIEECAIVTVDRALAVQLISAGKAERVELAKPKTPVSQQKQTKRGKRPHGA